MAYEESLKLVTYEAGQDLTNSQYLFVAQAANDGQVDPIGVLGARATGILQNTPGAAGREAAVAIQGSHSKLRASAAIARGANVTSANDGRGVTAGNAEHINAIALEAALAPNDIITVEVLDGTEVA
jgi:hypothetical protein